MTEMRRPLIAGNWKMHLTLAESAALARTVRTDLKETAVAEVVLAPPFTALSVVAQELAGSPVQLAAQDVFWELQGAYTGAISPRMLQDVGCRYVIIGHSERRQYFGETDATVNRKIKAVLTVGLQPMMCIGETLAQREAEETLAVITSQLTGGLADLLPEEINRLVIAYEPVWAIGTGRTATPEQAQEVHSFIRQLLAKQVRPDIAYGLRLLYGGSVTPDNIKVLAQAPDIDGALVGGASLKADSFLKIAALGN
ncbi:triosephosphate isomerase [Desulfobacca acetoxidans DSM 11109]|uniref:Triosephosphate isomerase n=2 Tax=Desulfobacca acetoxidans TaxID=60893 RepID=F2ND84_DESAR|nr:triose-phosphate isomerase [Desulfobacca acetoxidans]AEB09808.1 triosephosphate isomerase [Desulfobacca acetoxidans DSM 11109]